MGEVSAGIPAKPSERQSTDPVPTRAQPAESPDDYLNSETGPLCGLRPPDKSNDRGPTMPTHGETTPALGSDS